MQTGDDQSTFLAPDFKASLRKWTVLVISIQGCHMQSWTVYFLSVYRYAVHFWLISTSGIKLLCKCKVTPYCSSSDNEKCLKRCEVASNNAKSSCHRCLQPHLSKLDQQTYIPNKESFRDHETCRKRIMTLLFLDICTQYHDDKNFSEFVANLDTVEEGCWIWDDVYGDQFLCVPVLVNIDRPTIVVEYNSNMGGCQLVWHA